jgi:dTDP-4-dehydrorhamnose reductase
MLGRDVVRWLREQGNDVATSEARFGFLDDDPLISDVVAARRPVIVNCAAVLPGRANADSQWLVNALLPIRLATILGDNQRLIHASTDGVFSGGSGPYRVEDRPDAVDTYGRSKRAGEWAAQAGGVVVIRTSILGTSSGLLGWLLEQSGEVDGFVNHKWSGVTTLEWARRIGDIIRIPDRRSRIEHLASPAVSKFELLNAAARSFGRPVRVRRSEAPLSVDRSLVPTIATDLITHQLDELWRWSSP